MNNCEPYKAVDATRELKSNEIVLIEKFPTPKNKVLFEADKHFA